jgi:hypothetical protein
MNGLKSNIFTNGLALIFCYIAPAVLIITALVYWLPPRASIFIMFAAPTLTVIIIIYLARRV